ncbi:DUF2971 domain-containing protein [Agathobaculum sp. NTUH-O15-33]|uniref:DUF2971 domain-containing protein n=1 Tax=Agathobaculum sp. NTUH-O15-33 TaxID=3079302 RepID=UPI002958CC3E|nr:DUF2971 domain-containing protein [Agathobaculum sp. NTUH-O15-33]WNX83346.1 DUF2971 domain-containing protein [Agathobaculum sp. NTUH-O15-33]
MINEIDIMYHYCSLETFMKVLVTNRIWLSHVQTTNDALDDRMFLSSLERVVKKHKGDELFNNNLLEKMALTYAQKVDFPYIACFTRNKNLLSQWRAYGDDGKGVCIGFDLSKFSCFDLMHVKYGHEQPLVQIDEVCYHDNDDELIEKFLSVSTILKEKHNCSSEEKILSMLMCGLEELSVYLKGEGFSEEEEIRMVYYPCYRELLANLSQIKLPQINGLPIHFRSKNSKLISYFEYPLPEDSICEIVLGPKSEVDFNQLTLFLNQYAPKIRREKKISYSSISYR